MSWMDLIVFNQESFYNSSDLNRVNNNIAYIRDTLNSLGYSMVLPRPITLSNSISTFPKVSLVNDARANIRYIVDNFYSTGVIPVEVNPARLQYFNYLHANELEQNLKLTKDIIELIKDSLRHSGEFYSGQGYGL